jgi:hypothetical protein
MIRFQYISALMLMALQFGCGKQPEGPAESGDGGSDAPAENGIDSRVTNVQPAGAETTPGEPHATGTIERKTDGLWYEQGQSGPFTGKVVFTQDDTKWEEHYEAGKRTRVKAWDADGEQLELHAWNADGSPKD